MSKMLTWQIRIEYGPTAADVCRTTVLATTSSSALKEAENWAKKQGIRSPMFTIDGHADLPDDVPNVDDEISNALEWTPEEEEAFLDILNNSTQKEQ